MYNSSLNPDPQHKSCRFAAHVACLLTRRYAALKGEPLIKSDIARQIFFGITAAVFILIAARALLAPEKMAAGLGYNLTAPNGYSELYAVYIGVWIATAVLALVAIYRIGDALLGDLVAIFVLAQPIGRLLALFKWGPPQGTLFIMFIVEAIGGIALLLVRPSA